MGKLMRNNRGIALLIVLLVTALLIALVFEFAYGTRVSLRAAMNYRDSQRAYYLARSGVGYVWWNLVNMPGNLAHGEWHVIPIVSAGDTEVRVRWEDEGGKINIDKVSSKTNEKPNNWLSHLFTELNIDQEALSVMEDPNYRQFGLLGELHHIMEDDDFSKIERLLTVKSDLKVRVNINTAPREVLQSVLIQLNKNKDYADDIINRREKETITKADRIIDIIENKGDATNNFDFSEYTKVSRVYSFTTIGEYVAHIETVIAWSNSGFTIKYWRTL